jgi:hypothetical protein
VENQGGELVIQKIDYVRYHYCLLEISGRGSSKVEYGFQSTQPITTPRIALRFLKTIVMVTGLDCEMFNGAIGRTMR